MPRPSFIGRMSKETLKIMDELRKQFIGKEFTFEEFKHVTGTNDDDGKNVLNKMFLDCYVQVTQSGNLKVVHGKERTKVIERKKKICKDKINEYFTMYKHLEVL